MQNIVNWSFFGEVCERTVVYWSYYKSWHKLVINNSDKFIRKNFLYYKAHHIETSQSVNQCLPTDWSPRENESLPRGISE